MSRITYALAVVLIAPWSAGAQSPLEDPQRLAVDRYPAAVPDAESASGSFGNDLQIYVLMAPQFDPRRANQFWQDDTSLYYHATTDTDTGDELFVAQVELPAGATIQDMRCLFYDDDSGSDARATLWRAEYDLATGTTGVANITTVTSSGSGGYQHPTVAVGEQINHQDGDLLINYFLIAYLPAANANVRFNSCRMGWYRQVSPGPATATFSDVPTNHPYYDHIEALAAAGISDGCSDPDQFCPDGVITRGQIAVLLAEALGLHWPE